MKINTPTPSQSRKDRNSSIELYRIIATFTVLIVHFNGLFVDMPERFDFTNPTPFRIGQTIIESATCICVNMFLLISGYFGIRLKLQSVLKILLLLFFIYIPSYIWECYLNPSFLNYRELIYNNFLIISKSGYFIQCYLMLMFLSPALNAFIEKKGKEILYWVIAFFLIEVWFEYIRGIEYLGFGKGYSIMHFILMYVIARCLFLFSDDIRKIKVYYWIIGYLFFSILLIISYILDLPNTFKYSNPIVILSSICSFLPFTYLKFQNKIVNWIAISTFAVYIIQVTNPTHRYIVYLDNYVLQNFSYSYYLLIISCIILLFFIACILYDKLCQLFIMPIIVFVDNHLKRFSV